MIDFNKDTLTIISTAKTIYTVLFYYSDISIGRIIFEKPNKKDPFGKPIKNKIILKNLYNLNKYEYILKRR